MSKHVERVRCFQEGGVSAEHGFSLWLGGPRADVHWLVVAKLDCRKQASQGRGTVQNTAITIAFPLQRMQTQ